MEFQSTMDAHGYKLSGNTKTVAPDYVPSLVGVDPNQLRASATDPYFERIDITDRTITSLAISKWVTYDSLPLDHRDPILAVKSPGGNYYIPKSELVEIAAANQDDDTIELITALFKGRIY